MQKTEFERRWIAMREWLAEPRLIVQGDNYRFVARQSDAALYNAEAYLPIDVIAESMGRDSLGACRWTRANSATIACSEVRMDAHAYLALAEKARAGAGDA